MLGPDSALEDTRLTRNQVRGPIVMKGYWGREDATKDTVTSDGWLKTGDVAYVDEDNIVFIVDRIKVREAIRGRVDRASG